MIIKRSKIVDDSRSTIGCLMQPEHANSMGNAHGGEIMKLMDNVAGIAACRHSNSHVVTARVDEIEFHHPIHIGEVATFNSKVVFVGRSSIEVFVEVLTEDILDRNSSKVALTGYFTMVAIDENGKIQRVPELELKTPEEESLYKYREEIYMARKKLRNRKK